MPLKAELDAIKKNYVKLMKLPVGDLLPALKAVDVVSDDQREKMKAMTLDKERAGYLLDNVIIPTLKIDIREPFYNFLETLEQDENVVVKAVAKDLRSLLGPPMPHPGQPFPSQPQYSGQPNPYGGQPPNPYGGQPNPYGGQPNPYGGQQPNPYGGQPNPYGGQPNPYGGQQPNPYGGQQPNPYGGQPNPYGGQPNPYGGQQPNPYGGQQPNPYGGQPPNPYGGQQPNPYGGQQPNPYGGQQPNPYGGQPHAIYPPPSDGFSKEKVLHEGKGGGFIDEASLIDCKKSVCMIKAKSNGTGVIGRLKIKGSLQYVLLTCHHVIPTEKDATSAIFYFGYTNDAKDPSPCAATNILDISGQWFWTDPTYHNSGKTMGLNYSMMKVKKTALDQITFIDNSTPMNIQGVHLAGDVRIGDGDSFTLISQAPSMKVANGRCTEFPTNAVVKYDISTSKQSAGGPVFKEDMNKPRLVAIHNGSTTKQNYGVRLSEILLHVDGKQPTPMPSDVSNFKLE